MTDCKESNNILFKGQTSLWFGTSMGNVEVVKILIKYKADVNTKNNDG